MFDKNSVAATTKVQTSTVSQPIRPVSAKSIRYRSQNFFRDDDPLQISTNKTSRVRKKTLKEGMSPNYVGFMPPDMRTVNDLHHLRNAVETHSIDEKAVSIIQNLDKMVSNIPIDKYERGDAGTKLDILTQLLDAYNFAWNEASVQTKEISEKHASIFVKIRSFYVSLLEQYPKLLGQYQRELVQLKKSNSEKDQHIAAILQDVQLRESKTENLREFIAGLEEEIARIKGRKDYFKEEYNVKVLECEQLETEITDLKCEVSKVLEQSKSKMSLEDLRSDLTGAHEMLVLRADDVEHIDIGTDPVAQSTRDIQYVSFSSGSRSQSINDLAGISSTNSEMPSEHSTLRHVVFGFMVTEPEEHEFVFQQDPNIELKKFYWLFPKICSLFVSGLQFEERQNPFKSFDQMLSVFLTHHYQTKMLTHNVRIAMIQSSLLMEAQNPAIRIFNKFVRHEFDFYQFRFFHTALEYSICYATPQLSSLVGRDMISVEEAIVTIPKVRAREVFLAIFPFNKVPGSLNDGANSKETSFWDFMELLISEFDKTRKHFWSVLKNALILSDAVDINNIMYKQFSQFMGLIFLRIDTESVKEHWRELLRMKASSTTDRHVCDTLDFRSITHLCASRDEYMMNVMQISTMSGFAQTYFDLNASVINAVRFIVDRLTQYIPSLAAQVPMIQEEFNLSCLLIREALFMCDIGKAFGNYRLLLHKLDYLTVKDTESIDVSNRATSLEIEQLLDHMKRRETVVGINTD